MASSAHKSDKEKQEYFDPPEVLDKKITELAELIKKSKHFTAFTGAGISTSTGIPDFRSGKNTVLPTGPGAWEKKAIGMKAPSKKTKTVSMLKAIPSKTHMALVQLERYGILKFLISQNVDGLHRRSCFSANKLAELHGNTNLEICKKCGKKYLRDFRTRTAQKVHDHKTGRLCENLNCKGPLYDSIINFGENLPEKDMNDGFKNSECSDLQIVLGSSLRVTPAADMPAIVGKKAKLIIVNLQSTPLDKLAHLRINGMCDDVMIKLMEKLEIDIPDFTLQRRVQITKQKTKLQVKGLDLDGSPYELFKQITASYGKTVAPSTATKGPVYNFALNFDSNKVALNMNLKLGFFGHYGESDYNLQLNLASLKEDKPVSYILEYHPKSGEWLSCEIFKESQQV